MALFQHGSFDLPWGGCATWRIQCEALTKDDWEALASILVPRLPRFREAIGIPHGGLPFADALNRHREPSAEVIVVADDWTSGRSMREARNRIERQLAEAAIHSQQARVAYVVGAVAFAQSIPEPWVRSAFVLGGLSVG